MIKINRLKTIGNTFGQILTGKNANPNGATHIEKVAPNGDGIVSYAFTDQELIDLIATMRIEVQAGIKAGDLEARLKRLLPDARVNHFAPAFARNAATVEYALLDYWQHDLVPLVLGNQEIEYRFKVDGRCPHCLEVSSKVTTVEHPITDAELDGQSGDNYSPNCKNQKCDKPSRNTPIPSIASVNMIEIKRSPFSIARTEQGVMYSSSAVTAVHARVKSAGGEIDKLVDDLIGDRKKKKGDRKKEVEEVVDVAATRIITAGPKSSLYVAHMLIDKYGIANSETDTRIEYRHMDPKTGEPTKPYGFIKLVIPYRFTTNGRRLWNNPKTDLIDIETRIETSAQYDADQLDESMNHPRYKERKASDREGRRNMDRVNYALVELYVARLLTGK